MGHSLYRCKSSIKCWSSILGSRNGVDNLIPFNTFVLELQLGEAMAWKWAAEPQKEQQACVSNILTSWKYLYVCAGAYFDVYFSPILIDIKEFSSNK